MIKLRLPLKNIYVTQPFGVNYVDFYQKLDLKGHNGIDFRAFEGCEVHAMHKGVVIFSGEYSDGCMAVEIWDKEQSIKTRYLHLSVINVEMGAEVSCGQKIGLSGNSGKYTTGSHLHVDLKETDENGATMNWNNGFKGAIDPTPYFVEAYNGQPIGNKDCYKSNAYHRYFRGRPKGGLINEIKVVKALIPYLKRLPNNEEINACTYGGWNREMLINPAMYDLYAYLKRSEYEEGRRPFQD